MLHAVDDCCAENIKCLQYRCTNSSTWAVRCCCKARGWMVIVLMLYGVINYEQIVNAYITQQHF